MRPFHLRGGQPHTPEANPWGSGNKVRSLGVLPLVPPTGSARWQRPSLHRPLRGKFAGFPVTTTLCDPLAPFRRASLPSLGDTKRCVGAFAPSGPERPTAGQGFVIRSPRPEIIRLERLRVSQVPGEPWCVYALLSDPGGPTDQACTAR